MLNGITFYTQSLFALHVLRLFCLVLLMNRWDKLTKTEFIISVSFFLLIIFFTKSHKSLISNFLLLIGIKRIEQKSLTNIEQQIIREQNLISSLLFLLKKKTIFRISSIYQQMQEEFNKVLFEVAYSNLIDDFFQKNIQLNRIQVEYLRKCEGFASAVQNHFSMIKHSRKAIDDIDTIMKEMKDSFTELKIEGVYDTFCSIYRIMVTLMRNITEAYLVRFGQDKVGLHTEQLIRTQRLLEIKNQRQEKCRVNQQHCENCLKDKKAQAQKMEFLDYMIEEIENKEKIIEAQMTTLIADLAEEKSKVVRIQETNKANFFKEMYKAFGEISRRAESLFDNHIKNNSGNLQQLKQLSPEIIEHRVYQEMQQDIYTIVKKKLRNIVDMMYQSYLKRYKEKIDCSLDAAREKEAQQQFLMVEQQRSHKRLGSKSKKIPKSLVHKNPKAILKKAMSIVSGEENAHQKDGEASFMQQILKSEIEKVKKQNILLEEKLTYIQEKQKVLELSLSKAQRQYLQLQKFFKKRTHQLENTKVELAQVQNIRESLEENQKSLSHLRQRKFSHTMVKRYSRDIYYRPSQFRESQQMETQTQQKWKEESPEDQYKILRFSGFRRTMKRLTDENTVEKEIKKREQVIRGHLMNLLTEIFTIFSESSDKIMRVKGDRKYSTDHGLFIQEREKKMRSMIEEGKFDVAIDLIKNKLDAILKEEQKLIQYLAKAQQQQRRQSLAKAKSKQKKNSEKPLTMKISKETKELGTQTEKKNEICLNCVSSKKQSPSASPLPKNSSLGSLSSRATQRIKTKSPANYLAVPGNNLNALKEQVLEDEGDVSRKRKPQGRKREDILANSAFEELKFGGQTVAEEIFSKRQPITNLKKCSLASVVDQRRKLKTMNVSPVDAFNNKMKQNIQAAEQAANQKFGSKKQQRGNKSILLKLQNYDFVIQAAKVIDFVRCSREQDAKKYENLMVNIFKEVGIKLGDKNILKGIFRQIQSFYNKNFQDQEHLPSTRRLVERKSAQTLERDLKV